VLSRLSRPASITHVTQTGAHLTSRLERLPKWFPSILQPHIRGRGLIRGLGFRNENHPKRVMGMARERGVLLLTAGKDAVRLVPSLIVSQEEVDLAMDVLESCLVVLQSE
jgi:acetylornithine aminotransferase